MTDSILAPMIGVEVTTLMATLALYALANLRYQVPGTVWFILLCGAAGLWSGGYAFEKLQNTAEGFRLAATIEYLGVPFVPGLWFLVALHWMGHPWASSKGLKVLILSLGALISLAVMTNASTGLWYASLEPTERLGYAHRVNGPLYYPYWVFGIGLLVTTVVLAIRHRDPERRQGLRTILIVVVSAIPIVCSVLFQVGVRPGGIDVTVVALFPAFLAVAWGLFSHDLIRILPIARQAVLESMDQAVVVLDPRGRMIDHNAAAEPLLDDLVIRMPEFVLPRGEVFLDRPDGRRKFAFRRTALTDPRGRVQGAVVLLTDVTEEARLVDRLAHQATHDPLTGAANRRSFEDHTLAEMARADRAHRRLDLVLFDLDHFKLINDHYGHPAGDFVLKETVRRIQAQLRPYDFLARIGGEEFVVLVAEAPEAGTATLADRWRRSLAEEPIVWENQPITVTASFGVAPMPPATEGDPGRRLTSWLTRVDQALYQAKESGRNRVVQVT